MNGKGRSEHWSARAKRARIQRDAVALAVWCALRNPHGPGLAWTVTSPKAPKAITLTAYVARPMDDDGLQAACKAIRDGLQDSGLIVSDAPDQGHAFTYHQVVDRALKGRRGVEITVRLREEATG